jgi:hypothetical protein
VSDKIAIWNDFHLVPYKFFIHRHGLSYHFKSGARFSGGYAHLYQSTSAEDQFNRDENRWWYQIQQRLSLAPKWGLNLRFRHDMRWREVIVNGLATEDELFNHRLRFQTTFSRSLTTFKSGSVLSASLMNEYHYNIGGDLPSRTDQNRTALFVSLRKGNKNFITGYQLRTIPFAAQGRTYLHGFVLRMTHAIDLRKK